MAVSRERHFSNLRKLLTPDLLARVVPAGDPVGYSEIFYSYSSEGLNIEDPAFGRPAFVATPKHWYLVDPLASRVAASGGWPDVLEVHKKFKLSMRNGSWLKVAAPSADEQKPAWRAELSALHAAAGMADEYGYLVPHQKAVHIRATYLGGYGTTLQRDTEVSVVMDRSGSRVLAGQARDQWPHSQMLGFQLGGLGTYQTGGGWVGGGLGVAGALQGAAMASLFDALTTRTHNDCILRLVFPEAELTFQVYEEAPSDLELRLSALSAWLRQNATRTPGAGQDDIPVTGPGAGGLDGPPPPREVPQPEWQDDALLLWAGGAVALAALFVWLVTDNPKALIAAAALGGLSLFSGLRLLFSGLRRLLQRG